MLQRTGYVLLLLAAVSSVAQAASSTTKSSTSTFLLPSIATSASEHIYATLIKEDGATSLWALGCQPDVAAASPTCTGAFRPRRTLTSGPSTMHLELGGGGSRRCCRSCCHDYDNNHADGRWRMDDARHRDRRCGDAQEEDDYRYISIITDAYHGSDNHGKQ
ncbi:uncharacterized protein PG986_004500 [Apiospora aurea]|uniref:Uncharacterized protein n=1 Tax=Apiospora aurea TaxID=335848 RepID=A0ABR1QMS1_9PEZI